MSAVRIAAISILAVILVVLASMLGWRALRTGVVPPKSPPPAQQMNAHPQQQSSPAAPTIAAAGPPANRLGPFSIAGRDYFVELQTRKVRPGTADQQGDTVVAMEIRDAAGAVQYRRTFPYVEATDSDLESWSVSALRLTGTNGTGLLVTYDVYSEPSAPEEESTGWFQVFGVVNEKVVSFGAPLQIQGGLLEKYSDGHTYRSARPLDTQSDAVEFKAWTGHCRVMYPVRVDWGQGKLTPARPCSKNAGESGAGCQYEAVPEDKLNSQGVTFVRLWPAPDEKSGQPVKTVVKQGAKVDLLTARVPIGWVESGPTASASDSKGPLGEVVSIGVAPDADLWLKVRIDGKEGWMHSEEDFLALGLPEDE